MRLSDAARALGVTLTGADVEFAGVSTDTRQLPPGCLFVALRGPRFDGHAFVDKAMQLGAAAVMVEASHAAHLTSHASLRVADTRLALGRLAAWHRAQMPARLAAITGSNGKTTVKEMLAAILAEEVGADAVLATAGNLNNDIGMPLTLLRLTPAHRYAVIEMGMNHAGDLEGLGSVEAIARAKGEIYAGLKEGGIAIVNADDPHADYWLGLNVGHRVLRFGHAAGADVRIVASGKSAVRNGTGSETAFPLALDTPQGRIDVTLRVSGAHNRRNAAAAATAALALGASTGAVARGSSTTPTTQIPTPCWPPSRCWRRGPAAASWCSATWANWGRMRRRCIGKWGNRPRPRASSACSVWARCRPTRRKASAPAPCTSSASRNCSRKSSAPWARRSRCW